jgi:hypothetical protein
MMNPDEHKDIQLFRDRNLCTQAYPQELAGMLNELWPSSIASSLHFMSWSSTKAIFADAESYAQSFAQLMKAQLTSCEGVETDQQAYKNLSSEIQRQQPDLIIFHSPMRRLPIWLLPSSAESQLLKQIPVSLLVSRGL